MSLTQSYLFDDILDYNSNNVEISANKGVLSLEDNPGQIFQQDFDNDTGFTYNAALAEFAASEVRQIDQTPPDSILAAKYAGTLDAVWNKDGVVTGTANGTPSLVSGRVQCIGLEGVYYNVDLYERGAIKVKYVPSYNTAPPTNVNLIAFHEGVIANHRILLTHSPSGNNLRLTINNSTGTQVILAQVIGAAWQPTAGQEYEFELNWDATTGQTRLFIDGALHGSRNDGTWSFTNGIGGRLYVGADPTLYNTSSGSFDDLMYFSAIQHSSAYTPGYTPIDNIYSGSTVALPPFTYTGVGTIQSVDASSVTEANNPRYILAGLYWNGVSWTASNGTYAQANDFATVVAQLANLNVTGASSVPVSVIFTDQNVQGSVGLVSVELTGQIYPTLGYFEPTTAIPLRTVSNLAATITTPTDTNIGIVLISNGNPLYWNGTNWVVSDYSFAQSSSISDAAANIGSFPVNSGIAFNFRIILSSNGQATPEIETLSFNYNFFFAAQSVAVCVLYGVIRDSSGNPVRGATVTVNVEDFWYGDSLITYKNTTSTRSDGKFFLPSVETASNTKVATIVIVYREDGQEQTITYNNITIPNQQSELLPNIV